MPALTASETDIGKFWESAVPQIQSLNQSAPVLFKRTSGIEQAFNLGQRCLVCVDEGITSGIHLAGSGVLLSAEQRQAAVLAANIEIFTTHDNCGAYKLFDPHSSNPNLACKTWGEREAARLNLPHKHITAAEMDRPKNLHNAVAVYYDGAGRFNRIPGLPPGFVVSRKYFGAAAQSDLELCLKIALGDHGFGSRFDFGNPLTIVTIADPADHELRSSTLIEEVDAVAKQFGPLQVAVQSVKMPLLGS